MTTRPTPPNGSLFDGMAPSADMTAVEAAARAAQVEVTKAVASASLPPVTVTPADPPPVEDTRTASNARALDALLDRALNPDPASATPVAPPVMATPEPAKEPKPPRPEQPNLPGVRPQLDAEGLVPFDPQDTQQMFRFANFIARSELVPKPLRGRPYDVLLVLLRGKDLGLRPMQSIGSIHCIDGKTELSSQLTVALIRRSGLCDYWKLVESTDEIATYETLRRGDPSPTRFSYTMRDAATQGLINKDNWKRMPRTMLRRRCQSELGREVYPEITLGIYDDGELQEMRDQFNEHAESWRDAAQSNGVVDFESGHIVPTSVRVLPSGHPKDPLAERLAARAGGRERVQIINKATDPNAEFPWMDDEEKR